MVSWNRELVQAAIDDRLKLGQMLGVQVPEGFPSPLSDITVYH